MKLNLWCIFYAVVFACMYTVVIANPEGYDGYDENADEEKILEMAEVFMERKHRDLAPRSPEYTRLFVKTIDAIVEAREKVQKEYRERLEASAEEKRLQKLEDDAWARDKESWEAKIVYELRMDRFKAERAKREAEEAEREAAEVERREKEFDAKFDAMSKAEKREVLRKQKKNALDEEQKGVEEARRAEMRFEERERYVENEVKRLSGQYVRTEAELREMADSFLYLKLGESGVDRLSAAEYEEERNEHIEFLRNVDQHSVFQYTNSKGPDLEKLERFVRNNLPF